MKDYGKLHHIRPTQWFMGQCENASCDHQSVKWSYVSQQFLCWECQAIPWYRHVFHMMNSK